MLAIGNQRLQHSGTPRFELFGNYFWIVPRCGDNDMDVIGANGYRMQRPIAYDAMSANRVLNHGPLLQC
jgi:hypothetical protein